MMIKTKELNINNAYFPSAEEFRRLQWKKGWALSFFGLFVYAFLRVIGKKPRDFHGICPYFSVGKGWGGFEMGWFFVCAKDADEELKCHELGHAVVNANIGGLRTLFYSTRSALRYWRLRLFRLKTPYFGWWYESQASVLGREYLRRIGNYKAKKA